VLEAVLSCLEFTEKLNEAFFNDAKFRPVGNLKGVTGARGKPQLSKKISREVLKGLGFPA
jgi:hypothetical protein